MMLKTVYGPPPEDEERIEAVEREWVSAIQEEEATELRPETLQPKM